MTAHTFHAELHREGLADGCPRCEEIAELPFTELDDEAFGALWRQMIFIERDKARPRSEAEAEACRQLYHVAIMIERTQPWLDPWVWPWAIRAKAAR